MTPDLDLASVISSLTLAGILWVLKSISSLDKRQSIVEQLSTMRDQETALIRLKINGVEAEVQAIKVQVAAMIARCDMRSEHTLK